MSALIQIEVIDDLLSDLREWRDAGPFRTVEDVDAIMGEWISGHCPTVPKCTIDAARLLARLDGWLASAKVLPQGEQTGMAVLADFVRAEIEGKLDAPVAEDAAPAPEPVKKWNG